MCEKNLGKQTPKEQLSPEEEAVQRILDAGTLNPNMLGKLKTLADEIEATKKPWENVPQIVKDWKDAGVDLPLSVDKEGYPEKRGGNPI